MHDSATRLFFVLLCSATSSLTLAGELTFRGQELPTRLQVGYAVQILDMNQDQRLDIVIVDSKRILWLENPNWEEHVMLATPEARYDNVCFAPYDIDGDGKLDFAVGSDWQFNNTSSGGKIGWISPGDRPDSEWTYHAISEEPTVHRMTFADIDGDQQGELVVAPLKGRNTTAPDFAENGVRLLAFEIPKDPRSDDWPSTIITEDLHVAHNLTAFERRGADELLVASFEGVTWLRRPNGNWTMTRVGAGEQDAGANRGASEVKLGRLGAGDRDRYIATIEPWHGNQVVVYTVPKGPPQNGEWLWDRHILDNQLKWGHAVWCANLDQDDEEELIIGVRDDMSEEAKRGLRIYDPRNPTAGDWERYLVDPGSVAIEDLAAGDLNGDGRPEIVAVGRQTHNVKIYWNETKD